MQNLPNVHELLFTHLLLVPGLNTKILGLYSKETVMQRKKISTLTLRALSLRLSLLSKDIRNLVPRVFPSPGMRGEGKKRDPGNKAGANPRYFDSLQNFLCQIFLNLKVQKKKYPEQKVTDSNLSR